MVYISSFPGTFVDSNVPILIEHYSELVSFVSGAVVCKCSAPHMGDEDPETARVSILSLYLLALPPGEYTFWSTFH